MKLLTKLSILLFVLGTHFFSCKENDNFSTNPNLKLEFSDNIMRFDTVFTTIPSPMQRMKIYNRNNNSISFESIELVGGDQSGFRINVDGHSGTRFEDIDLYRKDSIYIVADAKLKETNGNDILVEDAIRLKWNGNTEHIQLGAYGINVDIWDNKTISDNTTLTNQRGYYIRGALIVEEGATLTIEEGTVFYLDKKASITINGTIVAKGTIQKPIVFRSHRFDIMERNILFDNASGQWESITLGANSFDNIFENVRIRGSQKGIDILETTPNQQKVTLTNTVIHNTSQFGIRAINAKLDAVNCQITNSRGALLNLIGGSYSFLHCTIANYYEWHPRNTPAVFLENSQGYDTYPLTKCEFKNSIIVGTMKNEIGVRLDNSASFLFSHCVIQAQGASIQPQFENIVWNTESPFKFKNLNKEKRFIYSFELSDNSPAINKGNVTFAQDAPTDLRGISRLANNSPDIGAYEKR